MIDCPPPYAADDVDSFRCGNGIEIRITADVEANELWLDGPERKCGAVYWQGKKAMQAALDNGPVEVIQAHDARSGKPATAPYGRLVAVVRVNGVDWHAVAESAGLARIVDRDDYEHGVCP